MTADKTINALWTAAEVEKRFGQLRARLEALHPQLPEEFDTAVIPLLDEFRAAHCLVKALKYDLLFAVHKRA